MKVSILKISLILIGVGVSWMAWMTIDSYNLSENFALNVAQTGEIEFEVNGDIGFYKVSLPELGDTAFVQILDNSGNIISDKKLETKLTINYFDINQNGIYSLKITNISNNLIPIEIQVGQFNTEELTYPGFILISGIVLIILVGFMKMKNYRIAQPDENIS